MSLKLFTDVFLCNHQYCLILQVLAKIEQTVQRILHESIIINIIQPLSICIRLLLDTENVNSGQQKNHYH